MDASIYFIENRKMLKSNSTYIIAEMACSHDGKLELGKKIIDGAGQANANAIQFQIWSVADMVVPHHPDYNKLAQIELSHEEWTELANLDRSVG